MDFVKFNNRCGGMPLVSVDPFTVHSCGYYNSPQTYAFRHPLL